MAVYVLAHLSDPHLAPLPPPRVIDLASKRMLGYLNWQRKRRTIHQAQVLEALTHDLKAQAPNHVAVTGDVVNIALAAEFTQARTWLAQLGSPRDVTLVPGNHDAYVRSALRHQDLHWGDYMQEDGLAPVNGAEYPFVRRRGPLALIGLSSAVPTGPFMATGRLGDAQLQRLGELLPALSREKLFRVVLIHHPPLSAPTHRFKWLIDAKDLRAVLEEHGAELLIHGHDHVHSLVWLDGPKAPIPALGVPSASAVPNGKHEHAAYNLYRVAGKQGAWLCEVISRGYRQGNEQLIELSRRRLA
jgi:3',5'-cyclic AMP phosphodiesterase CpdA